jgi:hypothetical protein
MSLRVTVLALFLLLIVPAYAAAAAAPDGVDTLAFLEQRVSISTDGDATLAVTAVLAEAGPGEILLPFGFGKADSFSVAGRGVSFPVVAGDETSPLRLTSRRRLLALVLGPEAATGDTVVVRCRLRKFVDWAGSRGQFGAYSLARTFINDSDVSLGACRLVLEVPPGHQVRRVTGTEPGFKPEDSPVPPYAVGFRGGRGYAMVTATHLRPGGRARLGLQAERAHRGPVPLVAGVLIVLLYLWFFRDILAPRQTAATPSQASTGGR